jgi:hypothetical protein
VPFTNELFYVLWLPLTAAVQLALDRPGWLAIALVHVVVFHPQVAQQLRDWRAMGDAVAHAYRRRYPRPPR